MEGLFHNEFVRCRFNLPIKSGRFYLHQDCDTIKNKTKTQGFVHSKNAVSFTSESRKKRTLRSLSNTSIDDRACYGETVDVCSQTFHMERILDILISNFGIERVDSRDGSRRSLPLI
jgi:hypothetical protein